LLASVPHLLASVPHLLASVPHRVFLRFYSLARECTSSCIFSILLTCSRLYLTCSRVYLTCSRVYLTCSRVYLIVYFCDFTHLLAILLTCSRRYLTVYNANQFLEFTLNCHFSRDCTSLARECNLSYIMPINF